MVTRLMTEFSSNELHNDFPILIWTATLIEDQSLVSLSSDVTVLDTNIRSEGANLKFVPETMIKSLMIYW